MFRGEKRSTASARDASGFGLVEVIISMFLLTLLSLAFLPLLVDALRVAVKNNDLATATQVASEQLDAASRIPRTCAALSAFTGAPLADVVDERGTSYTPHRSAGACSASGFPFAVTVRVWVTADSDSDLLVESTTTVIIESAS